MALRHHPNTLCGRLYQWLDRRLHLDLAIRALRESAPARATGPTIGELFSAGRLALVLIGLLVLSGAALTLFYIPTPEQAFTSIQFLQTQVPAGRLIRGVHRWSALLLMALVVLHLTRVLLARAYRFPRDLNWWLGVGLLLLVFVFGATGYLLRWDIKAFTLLLLVKENFQALPLIGTPLVVLLLGGTELGTVPLFRGYAFHIWFFPLVLALLLGGHLLVAWRLGPVPASGKIHAPLAPATARRLRLLPGLLLVVVVLILAALLPAQEPVTGPVERSVLPHPDWLFVFYFLPFWFFKGPWRPIGSLVIPAAILLVLVSLPWLPSPRRNTVAGVLFALGVILWTVWLFGQTARMGAEVPAQGCGACHKPTIVGGAPTRVTEFEELGPDWLVAHLQDPVRSLIEPFTPPEP